VKRLILPLVALVVAAGGCRALGGDVAATVDGHDITVDQVRQLARDLPSQSGAALVKTSGNVLNGDEARQALGLWIQFEAIHHEFVARKGTVTPADRSSATQQVASLKHMSRSNKARLLTLVAEKGAMDRLLGSAAATPDVPPPSDAEVASRARDLIDQLPADERQLECADAIAGPSSNGDQVQALLDGGTSLTDASAFSSLQYASPVSTAQLCVSLSHITEQLPPELQAPFQSAPVGKLTRANFSAEAGEQTLFFRRSGPRTLTATDSEVLDAARSQLEQEAQTKAQQAQTANQAQTAKEYARILRRSDVEVDPRFGSFDPGRGVVAPRAPRAVSTTTTSAPSGANRRSAASSSSSSS
jgi:hypothetical protein